MKSILIVQQNLSSPEGRNTLITNFPVWGDPMTTGPRDPSYWPPRALRTVPAADGTNRHINVWVQFVCTGLALGGLHWYLTICCQCAINSWWLSGTIAHINLGQHWCRYLLLDGTKPLPELMLIYRQWGPVTITWGQFHKRYLNYQFTEISLILPI